ncbi:hypothetical protein [Enterovibrio norvegicus]|uniref:hypothetical protein n=1 Tax=Enterovibrio norvegicus TaxID=188144 RepID=UPI00352D4332
MDWTVEEARKAAKVYREAGMKVRVVRCKNYDSYVLVYCSSEEDKKLFIELNRTIDNMGIEAYRRHTMTK